MIKSYTYIKIFKIIMYCVPVFTRYIRLLFFFSRLGERKKNKNLLLIGFTFREKRRRIRRSFWPSLQHTPTVRTRNSKNTNH